MVHGSWLRVWSSEFGVVQTCHTESLSPRERKVAISGMKNACNPNKLFLKMAVKDTQSYKNMSSCLISDGVSGFSLCDLLNISVLNKIYKNV